MEPRQFTVRLSEGKLGYIVAECLELPGCISQGKTLKEALDNITEAIALWLESNDGGPVQVSIKAPTAVAVAR